MVTFYEGKSANSFVREVKKTKAGHSKKEMRPTATEDAPWKFHSGVHISDDRMIGPGLLRPILKNLVFLGFFKKSKKPKKLGF